MDENSFRWHGLPREPEVLRNSHGESQAWQQSEDQIWQLISAHAPIAEIMNRICSALDRQIGGIVSLICLPGKDPKSVVEIVRNAAVFGLEIFYSADITAGSGEDLGHIEMYSCIPRIPAPGERQLVERAMRLAAMAIECDIDADLPSVARNYESSPVRGNVPKVPVFLN